MKTISYSSKEQYWKRIQLISFVLAVFIIIRHNSSIGNYDAPMILSVYNAMKYSITEVAVPLFFLIAGFNFFNNFSVDSQKRKFKSRIKSLLVPYLVWNTIYCVFCIITSLDFFSRFFVGREKFVITPLNVLCGCVFHNNCNSHFWFVFDLMVCVVINPLIYYVIRHKISGLAFLTAIFILVMILGLNLPSEVFYRTDAFLYYYIGAFLGLHCKNFFMEDQLWDNNRADRTGLRLILKSHTFYFIVGFICVCSSGLLLIPELHDGIRCVVILAAAYGFWKISACCRYFRFKRLPQGGTTFLMYAAHGIIQPIIVKLLYLILPKYNWMAMGNFILAIFITVMICIGLRYITKRFLPPVDKVPTGWRR